MRTTGSFEYSDEAENIVLGFVTARPQTTNAITGTVKSKFFEKLHHCTTKRILEGLKQKGKIKGFKMGRSYLWQL